MKSFNVLFLERYPDRIAIVEYVKKAIGKDVVRLEDLTRLNLQKITKTINEGVISGSAKTYFSLLKAFLNLYKDEGLPCTEFKDLLRAKKLPSQNTYLTESEIALLEDYLGGLEDKSIRAKYADMEIDVLHAFLAECYCGARGCDVKDFSELNLVDGYLAYVSKKTHVLSKVPIHRRLREHLFFRPSAEHKPSSMNRTIKRICKICGINSPTTLFYHGKMVTLPKYEFVAFHTARRSFATNLSLRNVPISVISQMMNHGQNIQMTQRYIVADQNGIDENAMAFFR